MSLDHAWQESCDEGGSRIFGLYMYQTILIYIEVAQSGVSIHEIWIIHGGGSGWSSGRVDIIMEHMHNIDCALSASRGFKTSSCRHIFVDQGSEIGANFKNVVALTHDSLTYS